MLLWRHYSSSMTSWSCALKYYSLFCFGFFSRRFLCCIACSVLASHHHYNYYYFPFILRFPPVFCTYTQQCRCRPQQPCYYLFVWLIRAWLILEYHVFFMLQWFRFLCIPPPLLLLLLSLSAALPRSWCAVHIAGKQHPCVVIAT